MIRLLWIAFAFVSLAWAAPGKRASLPWFMQETAMTADGRLTFLEKPWWPRARALAEGGSFTLDLNGDGRPDTLVYRKDGNIVEAIDDTGKAASILNQASTCYVVSLKGTGLVDRMVAYIDNNADGKADEIDFRHYRDGYLRYAWFSENYDNDGLPLMELRNWTYVGENGKNKFRGNELLYLNKYDPDRQAWAPLSECPFAFWDENHDGRSDTVLRVSAAPLGSNKGADSDYANNYNYAWAPKATPLEQMGNMNVRFSFNIEPEPRQDPVNAPHYNFGFTLVGEQPYQYPDMFYTNPRRRPPQTVVRISWKNGKSVGMNYPAGETGFSWDESRERIRWEGLFWIYERRYLPNTGGPTLRWNQRREYSGKLSPRREIYYSDVDRRYHLRGASEGWLDVGHLVNDSKDLEFRYFDSDGDGYFDTWEVFEGAHPVPVRVTHGDPRARPVPLDRAFLVEDYNRRVLPGAIEADTQLIGALKKIAASPLAEAYEAEAAKTPWLERRRYCLDVARELFFVKARDALYARDAESPYTRLPPSRRSAESRSLGTGKDGYTLGDSLEYWKIALSVEKFVENYGAGKFEEARRALDSVTQ